MGEIKNLWNKIQQRSSQYADVMQACRTLLQHDCNAEYARNYLKNRLNNNVFYEKNFSFGWFPSNDHLHLLTKYISEDILINLNLAFKKQIEQDGINKQILFGILSEHNLIMPYYDIYGNIISIVGRSLHEKEILQKNNISKYKNTKFEKSLNLFGLNVAKNYIIEKDKVIIVEGQFDCITCHKHGYKNVVALGGVNLTKFQIHLLLRFTKNIILMLDNDDPGKNASKKIINRYYDIANISSFNWDNKKEKDADELLKSGYSLDIL